MPHMDMDIDGHGSTDYSDFEIQTFQVEFDIRPDGTDSNYRQEGTIKWEPLEGGGGLANNEVAELVYQDLEASLEPEDETADQNVSTAAEMRGLFGANLPEGDISDFSQRFEKDFTPGRGVDTARALGQTNTEDRIFQLFSDRCVPPFDDQSTGPGGGSVVGGDHVEKAWRQLTGRGPVLDQTDDLSITNTFVIGDGIIDFRCLIRGHLVWDVAEVSDAGRAFSVPDGV